MERISYSEVPMGMLEKVREVEELLHKSSVSPSILYLIKLRASQINGCAYCVDMHHKELKHMGESDLRLSSLCVWEDTPYFSARERAVLSFTEALTNLSGAAISDEVYQLLASHFNKEEIAFITLAVSTINVWNRLMTTFRFEPGKYQVA